MAIKKIAYLCALLSILSTPTSAQDAPTLAQLQTAQVEARDRRQLLSYRVSFELHTLDAEGKVTGSKTGVWTVTRYSLGAELKKVSESRSTLKDVRLPSKELVKGLKSLPIFFEPGCSVRLVRSEGAAYLYRTAYTGVGSCFDGLIWTDGKGVPLSADGRVEPARQYRDGREYVYQRVRMKMNAEGLPAEIEGEDVMTFFSQHDKNGNPLRVRVRLKVAFSDYQRPRTGEPKVIYEDIVVP